MSTIDRKRNSAAARKRQGLSAKQKSKGKCWCCRKFLAFLFSHIGLGLVVFCYSLLGAVIFRYFEEPYEKEKSSQVLTIRNNTVHNLWSETYKLNVLYKENWTTMASKEIEKFQQRLIEAVKDGYDGKEVGSSGQQWSLSGAWMYSLTVISTIGYGNRPRTSEGKLATIVYAIVGIPLMLLFLTNIGNILAKGFKCLYRYCCNCSNGEQLASSNHHHNLHSHHHLHDHYHVHHIALNDVSPSGHLIQCNSTSDPYRTTKCYSACNSNAQQYSVGADTENKICTEMPDHHSCSVDTLNRNHAHPHHSILRGATDSSDIINSSTISSGPQLVNNNNDEQRVRVPIILCVLLIVAYVFLGASMFYVWEGWSILDGSYFCFVTLSTIGFGDLMPSDSVLSGKSGSQKKLIITSAYIIGGMALIAMSFNLVHEQVLNKLKKYGKKLGLYSDDTDDESENVPHHHPNDEDFDV